MLLFAPCTVNRDTLAPYDAGVDYTPTLAWLAGGLDTSEGMPDAAIPIELDIGDRAIGNPIDIGIRAAEIYV